MIHLNELNFKTATEEDIWNAFKCCGEFPFIIYTLPKDIPVFRAVLCQNGEYYHTVGRLSYNPNKTAVKTYGRANCINDPVFYGCIHTNLFEMPQLSAFLEVFNPQQDNCDIAETIIVSKWVTQQELKLVAINPTESYTNRNEISDYIACEYKRHLARCTQSQVPILKQSLEFLSKEFSKKVEKNDDYKYKVSAYFSKYVRNSGFPGILYTSYATDGGAMNLAIDPSVIDEGIIKFERAVGMDIRGKGKQIVGGYTIEATESNPGSGKLIWSEVDRKYTTTNAHYSYFFKNQN